LRGDFFLCVLDTLIEIFANKREPFVRGIKFSPDLFVNTDFSKKLVDIVIDLGVFADVLKDGDYLFVVVVLQSTFFDIRLRQVKKELIDVGIFVFFEQFVHFLFSFHK